MRNLGVGAHVLLNGGQFSQAYIKHGDIIAMYDTRFIFDTDDRDGQGSGVVSQNRFQHKQPDVQHSGAFNMPGTLTQSIRENSEDLLGSISSSATNDQIADRVRYRNQDEMMAAVKDAKRMQILLKIAGKLSTLDMSKLLNDLLDLARTDGLFDLHQILVPLDDREALGRHLLHLPAIGRVRRERLECRERLGVQAGEYRASVGLHLQPHDPRRALRPRRDAQSRRRGARCVAFGQRTTNGALRSATVTGEH